MNIMIIMTNSSCPPYLCPPNSDVLSESLLYLFKYKACLKPYIYILYYYSYKLTIL